MSTKFSNTSYYVGFEVHTAVVVKSSVFILYFIKYPFWAL
jgi:hypothetical protein